MSHLISRKKLKAVRKERVDKEGNEIWFDLLMEYFISSPYAKKHSLKNYGDLLDHLRHRQALELRICQCVFPEAQDDHVSCNS